MIGANIPTPGITAITGIAPITATTVAGTSTISTSIATNRIVGRSTAGTGVMEQLTPVGITVSGGNITGIGGTVGLVDNVVPRADGTGGYTVQNSGLIVEDAIVSFTGITGDAGTDVITATGSAFANGQPIRFTSLTGGSGLNTTTNYFVREVSGATFKVETSIGGGAINFTTNITAGTLLTGHSVQANVTLSENTPETNSSLVLTPKGTGALIAGPKPDGTATGGNARGDNAICMVSGRSAAAQVSSGAQSVAIGYRATASGPYGVALGQATASNINTFATGASPTASGQYSAAIGRSISASGNYSYVLGNFSSATSDSGYALGGDARADRLGMFAYSVSGFSGEGTSQRAWFVLRQKTTTNSAVELTLNGATAGATNRLTIPSGKYLTGTINIAGIKSDGTAAASYIRQFSIKNVAGTTSLVGTVNTIGTDEAAGTSISITANDTNDALKVEVTGITSETWRWVAAVDVVEVAYGT